MVNKILTVVAAAVRSGDMIFTQPAPARHHHILQSMHQDFGIDAIKEGIPENQGFLLSDGTFASRWKARQHALRSKQTAQTKWGDELYSEDLW